MPFSLKASTLMPWSPISRKASFFTVQAGHFTSAVLGLPVLANATSMSCIWLDSARSSAVKSRVLRNS